MAQDVYYISNGVDKQQKLPQKGRKKHLHDPNKNNFNKVKSTGKDTGKTHLCALCSKAK